MNSLYWMVPIVILFSSLVFVQPITASSWLTGWSYRKVQTFDGTLSNASTGYPMLFNLFNASGTDSGNTCYMNNLARSDFGDVRFTSDDGISLMPYHLDVLVDGVSATFTVGVTMNMTGVEVTLYIYYGNSAATSLSTEDVFGFYDDFPGSSINTTKWDTISSDAQFTWEVLNSKLDVWNSEYSSKGTRWGFLHSGFPYQTDFTVKVKGLAIDMTVNPVHPEDPVFDWGIVLCNASGTWDAEISAYYSDSWVAAYWFNASRIGDSTYASSQAGGNAYTTADITITKLGDNVTVYWNGEAVLSANSTEVLTDLLIEASSTWILFQIINYPCNDGAKPGTLLDSITVQRLVSPEPVYGNWNYQESLLPIMSIFGLIGFFGFIATPAYVAWKMKHHEYRDALVKGVLIGSVCFGLLVSWVASG